MKNSTNRFPMYFILSHFKCSYSKLLNCKFSRTCKRLAITYLFIACAGLMTAQERRLPSDSISIEYLQTASNQATLFYGVEYEGYNQVKNYPYLTKAPCVKARLSYRNVLYPEVCLRLDLWKDELAALSPDSHYFVLFPEEVEYAELLDKHIIYHKTDSLPNSPSTGYYFLLYDGDCKVLEKKYATLIQRDKSIRTEWTVLDFEIKTRYYLLKDGVYHSINNQSALLKTLSPYHKELKQFISSRRLSFRKDATEALIQTIGEYEKLTDKPTVNRLP